MIYGGIQKQIAVTVILLTLVLGLWTGKRAFAVPEKPALTGVVQTPTGAPIAGANVTWLAHRIHEEVGLSAIRLATATTDSQGRFRFDDEKSLLQRSMSSPGSNQYPFPPSLFVQGAGWGSCTAALPEAVDAPPMVITLKPAMDLRVSVADITGKRPLTDVRLRLTSLAAASASPSHDGTTRDAMLRSYAEAALPNEAFGPLVSAPSGPDGVCTFHGLAPGATIRAALVGDRYVALTSDQSRIVVPVDPHAATGGTLRLMPAATVTGRIVYPNGLPAAGVRVSGQQIGIGEGGGSATTDASGRYTIHGLGAGACNFALDLKKTPDWTARAHEAFAVEMGGTLHDVDFTLIKGALITGRVIGAGDQKPAAGIEVGVYGPAHPQSSAWVQVATTAPDGTYRLRVPEGNQCVYLMSQAPNGYALPAVKDRNVRVANGARLVLDWRLPAAPKQRTIAGVVLGPDNKPVVGAQVLAESLGDAHGMADGAATTDAHGAFSLPGQSAALRLRARGGVGKPGAGTMKATFAAPGDRVTLHLAANAFVTLVGCATDPQGKPLPGAQINLLTWRDGEGSGDAPPVTTDAQGHFTLAGLWPDGRYFVEAQGPPGWGQQQSDTLNALKPGETLTVPPLALHRADQTVAGRVVNGAGHPVPGIMVSLNGNECAHQEVLTGADGVFRFDNAVAETVEVTATRVGESSGTRGADYVIKKTLAGNKEAEALTITYPAPTGPRTPPASSSIYDGGTRLLGKAAPALHPVAWLNAPVSQPRTLSGLRGKVVLLDFWGIGCGPCVAELPDVERLSKEMGTHGLVVIGISDSGAATARMAAFARENNMTFPIVIDTPTRGEWFGASFRAYGVQGIPAVAVLDRAGNVAFIGDLSEAVTHAAALIANP